MLKLNKITWNFQNNLPFQKSCDVRKNIHVLQFLTFEQTKYTYKT